MAIKIVAFSGKRGTGKTTAAVYLQEEYGFVRVSFANRLKEAAEFFHPGFSKWAKEKPRKELGGQTPREYLITLGSHERFYDPNYWVKSTGIEKMSGKIVVDDLRFPNEAEFLKELGAHIVRIERFEYLNVYGKNLDDPSETAMDNYSFDFVIPAARNLTVEDLTQQSDRMLETLKVF